MTTIFGIHLILLGIGAFLLVLKALALMLALMGFGLDLRAALWSWILN